MDAATKLAAALDRAAATLRAAAEAARRQLAEAQADYDAAVAAIVEDDATPAELTAALEDGPSEVWGDALAGVRDAATEIARSGRAWRRHAEQVASLTTRTAA